ncbi:MAG: hypothetical protein AAB451_00180 [Patescibacteria group bacterium]
MWVRAAPEATNIGNFRGSPPDPVFNAAVKVAVDVTKGATAMVIAGWPVSAKAADINATLGAIATPFSIEAVVTAPSCRTDTVLAGAAEATTGKPVANIRANTNRIGNRNTHFFLCMRFLLFRLKPDLTSQF